jgi:hypothetical protein
MTVSFPGTGLDEQHESRKLHDLTDLLSQSIIELRMGTLDPKLGNSISYLGTAVSQSD